jgi:hypothetical protein
MTIDQAYRRIEANFGFDDPTTMVGEAWDLVKEQIATLQSQLTASKKRVEVLENLMSYTKAFAFNVNPYRIEPKDTMEDECEELRIGIGRLCKVERILREGLEKIISLDDDSRWPSEVSDYKQGIISGIEEAADIARDTFKAAEEVK